MYVQWEKASVAAESEAPTSCLWLKSPQTPMAGAAAALREGGNFPYPRNKLYSQLCLEKRLSYPRPGSAHLCSCHVPLGCWAQLSALAVARAGILSGKAHSTASQARRKRVRRAAWLQSEVIQLSSQGKTSGV